jgi:hypothetical protein
MGSTKYNTYPGLHSVAAPVSVGGAVTVTVVVTGGLAATRTAMEERMASLANIVVIREVSRCG